VIPTPALSSDELVRCISPSAIAEVVKRGATIYYIFDDGHELPLLCACCGEPLVLAHDVITETRLMRGRRLTNTFVTMEHLADEPPRLTLVLEFDRDLRAAPETVGVPLDIATHLRHPPECPYRPRTPLARRHRRR
jgi:hypothetical protein